MSFDRWSKRSAGHRTSGVLRGLGFESLESRRLLHGVHHVMPYNGAIDVAADVTLQAHFDFDADPSSINASTIQLRDPQGTLVPTAVSYDTTTRLVTIDPVEDLEEIADFYQARVVGGDGGVREIGGADLEGDYTWYFMTEAPVYTDSAVISGLITPTAVEFSPDGRVFVAEKSGIIRVFDSLDDPDGEVFADLRTNVHNHWDRGLLGMALHPDFPSTPELYVLYTYDAPLRDTSLPPAEQDNPQAPYWGEPDVSGDAGPNTNGNGPAVSGRLSRLTVGTGNLWNGVEDVLVRDWAQQYPSHSIGDLTFGSDGALYASSGDGASFTFEDYGQNDGLLGSTAINDPVNQGGALRTQDLRSERLGSPLPDDEVGLNGSIIRIDPSIVNGGAALPDNPLFDSSDPNAQRIIAYGMRNPFRITAKPGTNEIWIGDVGWTSWEEINVVRDPTDSLVENFGWPAYEGDYPQPGYDALDLPLLEDLYADPIPSAHIEPFYAYEHGLPFFEGGVQPDGGTSSISGLAFSEGGNLPPAYDGALFVADFSRAGIWVMFAGVNGDPNPKSGVPVTLSADTPVQLKVGPDGDLYYVNVQGSIHRVRFEGVNVPPTAIAVADTTSGPLDLFVQFDATGSSDRNPDDTLSYRWDLDGDGEFDDSSDPTPSYTYTSPGVVTATLEVTDSTGLKSFDSVDISVGNTAPTAIIETPLGSLNWKVGDTISFSGRGDDPDEPLGRLPDASLSWQINILHCPGNACHTHFVSSFDGIAGGSFIAPDHDFPSFLELRLTATDPVTGFSDTQAMLLTPQTVDLSFNSVPAGLELTINGVVNTTPFDFTVIAGSENIVNAPSPQTGTQITHIFNSWSNGGPQTQTLIAGTAPIALSATFDAAADTTDDGLGSVSAQGELAPLESALMAFDNDPGTKWLDFANDFPQTRSSWIQYEYADDQRFAVSAYTITSANDLPERDPKDWTLYGSDDGINFVAIDTRSNETFQERFEKRLFSFTNDVGYSRYRLEIDSVADPATANSVQIAELEFIGIPKSVSGLPRVQIVADDPVAVEGVPTNQGSFAITRDGDLSDPLTVNYRVEGTASGDDYDENLSGVVTIPAFQQAVILTVTPVADGNSEGAETLELTLLDAPSYELGVNASATVTLRDSLPPLPPVDTTSQTNGIVSAQGDNGPGEAKERAFDGDENTKWLDFANQYPDSRQSWIQYQYEDDQRYVVSSYKVTSANDAPERDPRDWTLYGSNDGTNFVAIDTRVDTSFESRFQTREFLTSNTSAYNIYRLEIARVADPSQANSVQLAEIRLMGVPDGATVLPAVEVRATVPTTDESDPSNPGSFVFQRSGSAEGVLNVRYEVTNSSASDSDIVETLTGVVTFADGQSTVNLLITPIDDSIVEGPEAVDIRLLQDDQYAIGLFDQAIVTIVDNDTAATPIDITDLPGLTVSSQGENAPNETKEDLIDNSAASKWLDFADANPATRASWAQFDTGGDSYIVTRYTLTSANDAAERDPRDWRLLGSNDGVNFTELDSRSGEAFANRFQTREFAFSNTGAFSIFRLAIDSVADPAISNSVQLAELEIFGLPAVSTGIDISLDNSSVPENDAVGTLVGRFADDSLTYEFAAGQGDAGNDSFTIVGSELVTAEVFDFELKSSYTIRVRATDSANQSVEKELLVTVDNVNEPPAIAVAFAPLNVAEDSVDSVYDLSAFFSDPDLPPDTLTYVIVGNTAPGIATATIDVDELRLEFAAHANGQGEISVRATDLGGLSVESTLAFSVSEVNDAPVRTSGSVDDLALSSQASATSLGLEAIDYVGGPGSDEISQNLVYEVTKVPPAALGEVLLADGTTVVVPGAYSLPQLRNMQFRPNNSPTVASGTFEFSITDDGLTNGLLDSQTLVESLAISVTSTPSVAPTDTTDATDGQVTAQGENGASESPLAAFDNDPSTKWLDFANATPATRSSWIQYKYQDDERHVVSAYTLTSANDEPARDPADWTLLGSNDGVNFTILDTRTQETFSRRFETRVFLMGNTTGYSIYRLEIHSVANPAQANSVQLAELELIGAADGIPQLPVVAVEATVPSVAEDDTATSAQIIFSRSGPTDSPLDVAYGLDGSTADASDIAEPLTGTIVIPTGASSAVLEVGAVDDSLVETSETLVFNIEDSPSYAVVVSDPATLTILDNDSEIPLLDTTDDQAGIVRAQGENGSAESGARAFDNDVSRKWLDFANANPTTRASWIEYEYANNDRYLVTEYSITSANDAPERDPASWRLLGSNDGVNYDLLDTRTDEAFPGRFVTRRFSFDNSADYRIYRLEIDSVADPNSANSVQIGEIELFGIPGSQPTLTSLPQDVNQDGAVTALDALLIINQISVEPVAEGESIPRSDPMIYGDVNLDGRLSALDALMIINYIAREEPTLGELSRRTSRTSSLPDSTGSEAFRTTMEDDEDVLRLLAEDVVLRRRSR